MIAQVSVKGQTVIPEAVREQARIKPGDEPDVGYAGGLFAMHKAQATCFGWGAGIAVGRPWAAGDDRQG